MTEVERDLVHTEERAVTMFTVAALPQGVYVEDVVRIADRACNAAFHAIHESLAEMNISCSGDVTPEETYELDHFFRMLVRAVLANKTGTVTQEVRYR
jgi:hypothetical protein